MKFSIEAGKLAKALKLVVKAIPSRSTVPIFEHLLIVAQGDRIEISGMNYEFHIKTWINDVEVKVAGEVAVPAHELFKLIATVESDQSVTLEDDGVKATLKVGRNRYRLGLEDPELFPDVEEPEKGVSFAHEFLSCDPLAAYEDTAEPDPISIDDEIMSLDKAAYDMNKNLNGMRQNVEAVKGLIEKLKAA